MLFGSMQQDRLDEIQVGEVPTVVRLVAPNPGAWQPGTLDGLIDQGFRGIDEEPCDRTLMEDTPQWADDLAATEADDWMVAAADTQLAGMGGHDHKCLRGGGAADPLMPRHFPERHAHVDEAVDLETPAISLPDHFHGDHHLSGIRHRREPPEFPRGERDRLAEGVSGEWL